MRIVVLIIILLTVSYVSFSQRQLIGFKVGPNFTRVAGDYFEDADMRIGLNIGLTYNYFLSDNVSLGTEVVYSQRGFVDYFYLRDEQNNPLGTESIRFNYDYVAIPLKISYIGQTKFYGFGSAGIIPAFLVSAKTKIPAIGGLDAETADVKDRVTPVDIGGMIEAGAGYNLGERYSIFTSASAQLSFNKFTNDEYFVDKTMRHYGFALAFGAKYAISR